MVAVDREKREGMYLLGVDAFRFGRARSTKYGFMRRASRWKSDNEQDPGVTVCRICVESGIEET